MRKLSLKQKAFADYYLETGNASEAARRAGYSEHTAKEIGCENLTKPNIKQYIEERQSQIESKRIATIEEVMCFYTSVMRGEVKDQFELDAEIKDRLAAGKELMRRLEAVESNGEGADALDDGFIDALNGSSGEDWSDEEDN